MILEDWLSRLNEEFREAGVEQRRRPWEAIRRYSVEHNISLDLSSDTAKAIFDWFEAHSKPGAHGIGSLFESVYFYDTQFWSVSIPIVWGTVKLRPVESLYQMPSHLINELMTNPKQAWDFTIYWADCVDYGLGIEDLRKDSHLDQYGMQLLLSGDQELKSAIYLLSQHRPEHRAILNSRMALEIFLTSFIALKKGLTEKEAKFIGHDLNKGFDRFIEASGYMHLEVLRDKLTLFPQINERYSKQSLNLEVLWESFTLAQSIGTLITREFGYRNTLTQFM